MKNSARLLFMVLLANLVGCGAGSDEVRITPLSHPAPPGASFPDLVTQPDGTVVLSWVLATDEDTAGQVQIARRVDNQWTPPITVVEHPRLLANWADPPRLGVARSGELRLSWSRGDERERFGQQIQLLEGNAEGLAWSESYSPHAGQPAAEYGFVSLGSGDAFRQVIWLDGRETVDGGNGNMQLRTAEWGAEDQVLDSDVCSCCQTAMTVTDEGILLAYRDHSATEIRDIAVIRQTSSGWSESMIVHDDRWKIAGCPVNGPALAADGQRVALAWFTQALDQPRVKLALSEDGGRTFDEPIVLPDDDPLGRVSVQLLPEGQVVVVWLRRGSSNGEIVMGGLDADGHALPIQRLGEASPQRRSGFPRTTVVGNGIVAAWTISGREALRLVEIQF